MMPGQRITRWWQEYVLGRHVTPQDVFVASRQENPDPARLDDRFLNIPDDGAWSAPARLQAPFFILSEPSLRQWERADWQHVDRRLMRWSALFTELARKRGIPLYTHCAFRSEAEQEKAYAGGFSKARYPNSAHNIGEAVDVVHGVYHWSLSKQEWALLHVLGLRALDLVNAGLPAADKLVNGRLVQGKLSLTWGGHFKGLSDPAHWEVSDYRKRLKRLPAGPPVRYTPRHILGTVKL